MIIHFALMLISFVFAENHFYKEDFFNFSFNSKEYSCMVKAKIPIDLQRTVPNRSKDYVYRRNFRINTEAEYRAPFIESVLRDQSSNFSKNDKKCLYTIWLNDTTLTLKTNNQLVDNLHIFSNIFSQEIYNELIHKSIISQILKKELVTVENIKKIMELKNKDAAKNVFDIIRKFKIMSNFSEAEKEKIMYPIINSKEQSWLGKLFINSYDFQKERKIILDNKKNQMLYSGSIEDKAYDILFEYVQLNGNDKIFRDLIFDDDLAHPKLMQLIANSYLLEAIDKPIFRTEKCSFYKQIFDRINEVLISYDEQKAIAEFSKVKEPCVQALFDKDKK